MSIYKARVKVFEDILCQDDISLPELRSLCFNGIPDSNGLRSICWKILLGYLSCQRSTWEETLQMKRNLYKQFIEDMVLPPGLQSTECTDHPLSEGPESAWSTFFKDNEFLLQIDKDVRRLCPDISFFQQPTEYPCEIVVTSKGERRLHQRVAPSVLSSANVERKGIGITKVSAAKKHFNCLSKQDLYRSLSIMLITDINLITKKALESYAAMEEGQEAHWEVVQRMLFLYAKLNPGQGYVQGMNEIIGPIYYVMASAPNIEDREYAEADCFFCFTLLMSEIRDFFIKSLDDSESGIKGMMTKLSNMLQEKDLEVWALLKDQELHPQYYSFRWITLILSQEFPLPDVVRIWDSIFSDENRFSFLTDVCCAMIVILRDQILENDFGSNVKLLQNFPPIDINKVLAKAVAMRNKD